eukprot:3206988-Lingulodinium_polyedra.AAC.1
MARRRWGGAGGVAPRQAARRGASWGAGARPPSSSWARCTRGSRLGWTSTAGYSSSWRRSWALRSRLGPRCRHR